MSYPTTRKARSRARILSAARRLFFRHGFERVSITQVMREAQMTHGAFYAHFESKEALYSACFLDTLQDRQRPRLVKGPLSVQHLIALASSCWNLRQGESPNLPGPENVLFNEIGNDNDRVRRLFQSAYDQLQKMVETRLIALHRLRKYSEVPTSVVRARSRVILASLVGAVTMARLMADDDERQGLLEAAQKQIMSLLETAPESLSHKA